MKLQVKFSIRKYLVFSVVVMLAVSMAGCGGNPTATPEPTSVSTNTPEPTPIPTLAPPLAPTLNQSTQVTLEAGKQLSISASSLGASSFSWNLQGIGTISSDNTPAIIYTAPDGAGGIALLSVVAFNADGLSSPATTLTINVNPGEVSITDFEITTPNEGATLGPNKPADCKGTYELSFGEDTTGIYVWILAGDLYGNYYLQNPPVSFDSNGTWSTSIKPGRDITMLFAVQVTEDGNDSFKRKVENDEFGGFTDLPDGSVIHHSIAIQT